MKSFTSLSSLGNMGQFGRGIVKRNYTLRPRGPMAVRKKEIGVYGKMQAELLKIQFPEEYPKELPTRKVIGKQMKKELDPVSLRGLSASDRYQIKKYRNKLVMLQTRRNIVKQERQKTEEKDEASRIKFKCWRRAVLDYRKYKRQMALENILQQEEIQSIIRMETGRHQRTKRLRKFNKEAMHETFRVSSLRNLAINADQIVTPENLDEHIAKELNPGRTVLETVYAGLRGINDEVDYDVQREAEFGNSEIPSRYRTFEDPLFPNGRVYPVDFKNASNPLDLDAHKDTRTPISSRERFQIYVEKESQPEDHVLDFEGKKPTVVATNLNVKRERKVRKRTEILKEYREELEAYLNQQKEDDKK